MRGGGRKKGGGQWLCCVAIAIASVVLCWIQCMSVSTRGSTLWVKMLWPASQMSAGKISSLYLLAWFLTLVFQVPERAIEAARIATHLRKRFQISHQGYEDRPTELAHIGVEQAYNLWLGQNSWLAQFSLHYYERHWLKHFAFLFQHGWKKYGTSGCYGGRLPPYGSMSVRNLAALGKSLVTSGIQLQSKILWCMKPDLPVNGLGEQSVLWTQLESTMRPSYDWICHRHSPNIRKKNWVFISKLNAR